MPRIKTLLFTGGQIHDFRGCGAVMAEVLEASGQFDLTRLEDDLDALLAPDLDPYDLIVFYYTVGQLNDAQKNGLLNAVADGKGFVGVHSAADSFRGCPSYQAMLGGYFVTHPRYREYQVSVVDSEHPITAGITEFMVTDEQYILDYDPRVQVLCSALWQGQSMPVAWVKTWGKGRVFYLALGHDPAACRHEMFAILLSRGARWAAAQQES